MSVKVAIVGVGNCASALVQGSYLYRDADPDNPPPGLPHPVYCGYHVSDIQFVAAFDVSERKVGLDLGRAIHIQPNNHPRYAEERNVGVLVTNGKALDGVGEVMSKRVGIMEGQELVVQTLVESGANVVVNFLPVGSTEATSFYAESSLSAGCSFVNAIPVPLAREQVWRDRFAAEGLALIGDDIKSQVGATIVHRRLIELMRDRGARLDRTYQLNVGGNMDFFNMLEVGRLTDKKISKAGSITDVAPNLEGDDLYVGPSDYIPWLQDHKVAYVRLEGTSFGNLPIEIEVRLSVTDSANSAGMVIDAIRAAVAAEELGEPEAAWAVSPWFMKAPPFGSASDDAAMAAAEDFHLRAGAGIDP